MCHGSGYDIAQAARPLYLHAFYPQRLITTQVWGRVPMNNAVYDNTAFREYAARFF